MSRIRAMSKNVLSLFLSLTLGLSTICQLGDRDEKGKRMSCSLVVSQQRTRFRIWVRSPDLLDYSLFSSSEMLNSQILGSLSCNQNFSQCV